MWLRTVLALAAALACLSPAVAAVATSLAFNAVENLNAPTPAQVFVHDDKVLRPAKPDDDSNFVVLNGAGDSLAFTLEKWRAGSGTVDIMPDPDGNGDRVIITMHRLIAFGHYSVFIRTDDPDGTHFAPLDGSGLANNFDAHVDGSVNVTISTPEHLTSGSWIVLVYHSDAQDHGNSPGDFGRTAHQQFMAKVP